MKDIPPSVGPRLLGWRNLALALISLLGTVALFEVAVVLSEYPVHVHDNWRYHPVFGWTDAPGSRYQYTVMDGREVDVEFNSLGFRGNEPGIERAPGTRRAVVLGDSFSAAVGVNLEETFAQQLESLLNRDDGPWEVINLGVGDFGTTQQLLVLEEFGLAFEPDLVIHQIFPLNDICNNNQRLYALCKSQNDFYRPYPRFLDDGRFEVIYPAPVRKFFRDHLASYFLLERSYKYLTQDRVSFLDTGYWNRRFKAHGYDRVDPLLYTYMPTEEQRPDTAPGWRLTEQLIERIVGRTQEMGADYFAIVIPFRARVGDQWEAFARSRPGSMDVNLPENRLDHLFRRLDVPYIMVKSSFDQHPSIVPYIKGEGHLNPDGHRLVASETYRVLMQKKQPSSVVEQTPQD